MTTEDELANVVVFPTKKDDLKNDMTMRHEVDPDKLRFCSHVAVWVNRQERTVRCRRCDTFLDPFNYILTLCDQESKYVESVKYLRQEEKQRRQNIEKLIQIERNAKARIRKAGNKEPLPLWQNEKVEQCPG
ncbi:hypothetical protein LU604_10805 [Erwinia tracheiphila]|uniref:Uncharacterized protein n=1 Tax=Erwinia tracheiphila TaxID=65700 RepID=A0A345CPP8_9GAMM|nr:hypothetical protein [Erwinia tracheiphila]AXF75415.1 hypothetical protein AV903_03710 [Erwinia tracheiphila]AXF76074.1 hypothetical protein AV903_08455 [Erwinia tracheiphila]UIA82038.1 hypothetical protein LU604_15480 [Erwinia tracheiphila]UIA85265.1 hypothetical protein LU604_10805 [Erwinia tracheiphila]UIA90635.1 hypothetical protein LU632_15045 [Erwinia tracheiphila]